MSNSIGIKPTQDHDSPWKEALELRFPEFLDLLFPSVAQLVDCTKPIVFLDKELQKIMPEAEQGRTYADKLVQVHLKDGDTTWILIHVEVQGEPEKAFAKRMFQYNYRIQDKYNRDVISLAVLSDTHASFRPTRYEHSLAGCRTVFEYPTAKLLDWKEKVDELLASENVFALIVAAQLYAKLIPNAEQQLDAKAKLIRLLYEREYSRDQIIELFRLVDWMIRLPDNLAIEFKEIVHQIEEEKQMAYITSVERLAAEEAKLEGKLEGKLETALQMIKEFHLSAQEVAEKLQLPLKDLMERLKHSESNDS
ncbi:hypothetical protein THMIRHAS_04790 [Thiosulfatimonas sediminis]|uniref:Uncharacterized protein n=1 Tax=Thiosulfatimonas sediminis TaxID=2675054 RepID=A0A6F8PSP3_9GAMM|nr:Rpn family recombination-promoting nuclease/putative transposase [Thiosulfatimonas sediminis]BBP45106.1 hypothetical protein THMIRHAS_04790 [Thiosulfatimonas sediminis]